MPESQERHASCRAPCQKAEGNKGVSFHKISYSVYAMTPLLSALRTVEHLRGASCFQDETMALNGTDSALSLTSLAEELAEFWSPSLGCCRTDEDGLDMAPAFEELSVQLPC